MPWIGAYDLFAASNAVGIMLRVVIQVVTLSVKSVLQRNGTSCS
ncbi:hypothetical protein ALQ07_04876 [Pseudomonas syringae pv. actinidiae]|uniref:Uncharacterized protein n=1 Tax=Pseudomonas syringae pv. actinidiae TaxID=103796 RepID=A0A3M4L5K7_PSESF|nr:hypothetical protein ALQ07_04876 [Pseudomonas syringae pv. actinidiae]